MLIRVVNAIGIIFLIGSAWTLCAHFLQWDNATSFCSAAVFGVVVYFGFKTAN